MNSPKYTKLLTPEEYDKLTLDEKTIYITDMATVLRSRIPTLDPPLNATDQAQDEAPLPGAPNPAQDDPPPPDATNQAQADPPGSDDKPTEP